MESHTSPSSAEASKRKQALGWRLLFFFAGSGVNYLLISTPFKYLREHTGWSLIAISACSLLVSTTFFFFWNYFVNFRTDARKRDALPRYLSAVALMWILSTLTLTALKHFNAQMSMTLAHFPLDLDIIATQFFLGGFKFLLYHTWAFPAEKRPAA